MSVRILLLVALGAPLAGLVAAVALGLPRSDAEPADLIRVPLQSEDLVPALPGIAGPANPSLPLIVIDAGHGGRDPGAVGRDEAGRRIEEKAIVLDIALALRDLLLEEGRFRVAMTRDDDTIVPLMQRPEIARALEADLFLSIHADSAGTREDVAGASIYTLSNEASSEAAARFAARENAAAEVNGVAIEGQSEVVSAILVELSQQRSQGGAIEFAQLIQREGEGRIAFHPQVLRSAALAVLRAPDVPGVLFESGFVTNASDRARLTTEEGRREYAQVLARAVRVYFARRAEP
ncbi:MAG: N-acetylmuramoyl-L-alanine amidase [Erythrobacter sp.]